MMHPSAHTDTFTRDNLPPDNERPDILHTLPGLDYPAELNCVDLLLDVHVREGRGGEPAIRSLHESWTYQQLQSRVNSIANVLVSRGVKAGERVLLRFPNSPLFAAGYLAVLKCGAVAVHMSHRGVDRVVRDARAAFVSFTGSVPGGHAIQHSAAERFIAANQCG